MQQWVHWLLRLEVFSCSLRMFSKVGSMLTGWLFIAHVALRCCYMPVLTPATPPLTNLYNRIWLLLLAASPDVLLPPTSLQFQKHQLIACLDLLHIWSSFSVSVSGSSDHLPPAVSSVPCPSPDPWNTLEAPDSDTLLSPSKTYCPG